jgi:hypothetical protein
MNFNIFSGNLYTGTDNFKVSSDGRTFLRCGDNWFSDDGQLIQQRDDVTINYTTGVMSTFGDPFAKEQK